MRCYACNKILSNVESTRKFKSGEFVDMCTKCLDTIQESVVTIDPEVEEGDDDEQSSNG